MASNNRGLSKEEMWVSAYEELVASLNDGYSMCINEYTNDLSCRQFIEENIDNHIIKGMLVRIEIADEKFKSLLISTKKCIHGSYPKECFWYWGYPPNSPELEDDLRKMGFL